MPKLYKPVFLGGGGGGCSPILTADKAFRACCPCKATLIFVAHVTALAPPQPSHGTQKVYLGRFDAAFFLLGPECSLFAPEYASWTLFHAHKSIQPADLQSISKSALEAVGVPSEVWDLHLRPCSTCNLLQVQSQNIWSCAWPNST